MSEKAVRAKLSIEDQLQALAPVVGKYIRYLDTDDFDDTAKGVRTAEELRACVKARKLIARCAINISRTLPTFAHTHAMYCVRSSTPRPCLVRGSVWLAT